MTSARLPVLGSVVLAVTFAFAPAASAQQKCEGLTGLKLPNLIITSATMVPEGPFSAGGRGGPGAAPPQTVAAHCDVRMTATPTRDSEIKIALWLPASGWNGKYRQEGNGGWAGNVQLPAMIDPLNRGYASASTDDGHEAPGVGAGAAVWAVGHPEKLIDFGYRAVHETNLQSRAVIRAFYGQDPSRSYFVGCSDGGREAFMEATRFSEDFDGIIAGAPANSWTHGFTGFIWNEQALLNTPAGTIQSAKLPAITKAVMAACDANDGVKDGLLTDPRACKFDPTVLQCKGADGPECLTKPQVDALKKIYAGPKNPRTGEQIYPGFPPGAEGTPGGWAAWIAPEKTATGIQYGLGNSYYGQAVFEDPSWDFRKLDFDKDVAYGDEKLGGTLNSNSPDLRSFRARGGKLIQYHGWSDGAISPLHSIEYYEKVRGFMSKAPDPRNQNARAVEDFYRLFMVPGMGHCAGGLGPNVFGNRGVYTSRDADHDIFAALERWVENGVAPDKIVGSGKAADDPAKTISRPLCPHPQAARYNGSGDPNSAASFTCTAQGTK